MSGMILSILHPILSKRAFRLSVSTAMNFSDNMQIKDVNGRPHPLTQYQLQMILIIGWVSFFLSWICNIIYYKFHPSGVDFNVGRSRVRVFIYFLGEKVKLPGYREEKEFEEEDTEVEDEQNTVEEEGGGKSVVEPEEMEDTQKTYEEVEDGPETDKKK